MAKKVSKLAYRYANALRNAATSGSAAGDIQALRNLSDKLLALSSMWERDPKFSASMLNPMFKREERIHALVEVAKLVAFPDSAIGFLHVLVKRDRLSALPEIAIAFKSLVDETAGVIRVDVVTASDIEETERREIGEVLARKLKGDLEFSWSVDKTLIGGIMVSYSGKVLDGSLRGKLAQFERILLAS
jgi:F-type H+-transporting ATPase subunit delta